MNRNRTHEKTEAAACRPFEWKRATFFALAFITATLICIAGARADFGSWGDAPDSSASAWGPYTLNFSGEGTSDVYSGYDYDWIKFQINQPAEVTLTLTNLNRTSYLQLSGYFGWDLAPTSTTVTLAPGTYYVGVAAGANAWFSTTRYRLTITAVYGTACYADDDGDGYGDPADVVYTASCAAGRVENDDDCDDTNPARWSGALDICDGIDNDCDGTTDEDCATYYKDSDGDGYGDPGHTASAPATGYVTLSGDCDDDNPAINPGATEVCDGIDNNCDGAVDDLMNWYYPDEDGDGYGGPAGVQMLCSLTGYPGYVDNNLDCDDFDRAIYPGAPERCNSLDDDCDGAIDEGVPVITYYYDYDGDGWGIATNTQTGCTQPAGYVTLSGDCNDNDARIHPGAFDSCDTPLIDENCTEGNADCQTEPVGCSNLADFPLETMLASANPMVEFLFDDSGSMAWEIIYQGTYNGLFYYKYYDRGVRTASVNAVFNTTSDTIQGFWQTQCYEENGLYYNPNYKYTHWPNHSNADPDTPKFTPDGSTTLNMDGDFTSVGIKNAHYFIKSGGSVYLVDLRSTGVRYYSVSYETGSYYYGRVNSITLLAAPPAAIQITRTLAEERQNFANWFQFYRTRQNTAKASILQVINSLHGVRVGIHTINQNNSISISTTGMRYVDTERSTILGFVENIGANDGTPLRVGLKAVGNYFMGNPYKNADGTTVTVASPYAAATAGGECQQAFAIVMTDGYYNDSTSSVGIGNADADTGNPYDGPPFADSYTDTLADVAMYYYKNDLRTNLANLVPANAYDTANHQHLVTYGVCFGLIGTIEPADYPSCPGGGVGSCPSPWPSPGTDEGPGRIDDLYHAAVNGRGRFISAANPLQLVQALQEIMADVTARRGSSASVAVSTQSLREGTLLFQGSYDSSGWKGDLEAFGINPYTAVINPTASWSTATYLDSLSDITAKARNIYTSRFANGDASVSGVAFSYENLSGDQLSTLGADETEQRRIIDFIKGDMSRDLNHGGDFRARRSRMGDIVHSAPVHDQITHTLYVGANDGMLHAVDSLTGVEKFAFIPGHLYEYSRLYRLADPNYKHKYYVDSTPFVRNGLLICGLGKGGKGYFALDVSDPDNFNAADVLWEYPVPDTDPDPATEPDPDMGYSFSRPAIVNSENYGKVVVFGNGYSSTNMKAVLYVIDINDTTGAIEFVQKIDTGVGGGTVCNGLSTPTIIGIGGSLMANIVYAGDLQGNLWKFDLSGDRYNWKVACRDQDGNPAPLFQAKDESGKPQVITSKPAVTRHCSDLGYIVVFGTGQFFAEGDFYDTTIQAAYGIWDWAEAWDYYMTDLGITDISDADVARMRYGYLQAPVSGVRLLSGIEANAMFTSPNPAVDLTMVKQVEVSQSEDTRQTSDNTIYWFSPKRWLMHRAAGEAYTSADGGFHVGWYLQFPGGERVISDPQVRMVLQAGADPEDRLAHSISTTIFMSFVPSVAVCRTGGYSIFNMLNACSGSWLMGEVLDDIYYKPPVLAAPFYVVPDADGDGEPDIANPNVAFPGGPGQPGIVFGGELIGQSNWRILR
ncbi:MAG: PilC/PilY family type IV pilus protein [Thermodesulfobacteriota bacterium]